MDAVSDTCHGVGHYLLQSGIHHFYGLSGYIGRMDLHIYLSLPAHLCSGYLLESFPTLSEIFVEETLSDLFVIAFYCDDRSSVDTDVNRIHVIFLLAGTPCARFLFFDAHGSGLYFFFYVIYAVYDRRYDDSSSERVDD